MSQLYHCKGLKKNKDRCKKMLRNMEYCYFHKGQSNYVKNDKKDEKKDDERYREDTCPVCLDDFEKDFKPLERCNHWVHRECVAKSGKSMCPVCREEVVLTCPKHIEILIEEQKKQKLEKEEEDRQMAIVLQNHYNRQAEFDRILNSFIFINGYIYGGR